MHLLFIFISNFSSWAMLLISSLVLFVNLSFTAACIKEICGSTNDYTYGYSILDQFEAVIAERERQ